MKKQVKLHHKALLLVALILFFILTVNTIVLTYSSYRNLKNTSISKTREIANSLNKEIGKVLELGMPLDSLTGLNEKLFGITSREKLIMYAMVTGPDGYVIFHNNHDFQGKKLTDEASRKALSSSTELLQDLPGIFDMSFPLHDSEKKIVGALRIGMDKGELNGPVIEHLYLSLSTSAITFVISMILVHFVLLKFLTQPILLVQTIASKIASGELDHTILVKGSDEIASLGETINRLSTHMKDILTKIRNITNSVSRATSEIISSSVNILSVSDIQRNAVSETSNALEEIDASLLRVTQGAEILSDSASNASTSIHELTAAIEKTEEHSKHFSEMAQETASSIEEMVATIKQISESLENLTASSEEIASSINEVSATTMDIENRASESVHLAENVMTSVAEKGTHAAATAMEGMEDIKRSVIALADVINMLGKRTEDIGKILNVIVDLSDQTNLLAINAAILASKAGEHGKGFSVVADEIKSLSERTSFSTKEISELIKSVQDGTKSIVSMVSGGIDTVEKGLMYVKDVDSVLTEIRQSSKASTEMARAIQRATSEESVVIRQITKAVSVMTDQTENISRAIKEQSKGSQFIIDATEKIKETSQEVSLAMGEQKQGSMLISGVIENVYSQSSEIVQAVNLQKDKSMQIIDSMKQLNSTTGNLINSSRQMDAIINSLKEEAMLLLHELKKFKV